MRKTKGMTCGPCQSYDGSRERCCCSGLGSVDASTNRVHLTHHKTCWKPGPLVSEEAIRALFTCWFLWMVKGSMRGMSQKRLEGMLARLYGKCYTCRNCNRNSSKLDSMDVGYGLSNPGSMQTLTGRSWDVRPCYLDDVH